MCESNGIVKLNLRGTRFETLSSTLSKDPNSLLGQMMNPDYPMKPMQTQDGYYFFDRSPDCFKIILDYLSQGDLEEEIPKRELLKLEKEAKFFKLSKLEKEITARLLQIQTEAKMRFYEMSLNEVKKDSDVIKFNVSGTIFQIARSKLAEYPDCLLTQCQYVKDGYYFFDRSPDCFKIILDYLSQGDLEEEIPKRELLKLEKEAKFFKLSKLEQEITARLLQIETEAKMSLNEVKKDSDVIKFNVSGTIFQIARSKLAEYPDCLLTQYVKGTKEPIRDANGNIYLGKDVETYWLIFSCLQNPTDYKKWIKISGDINLLYAVRKEFEHLNLQAMKVYLNLNAFLFDA